MKTQIKFPRHSFVTDASVDSALFCGKEKSCLPAAYLSDWKFQIFITEYGDMPNDDANWRRFYVGIQNFAECEGDMPMNSTILSANEFEHIDLSASPIVMSDGTIVKGLLNLKSMPFTEIMYKYVVHGGNFPVIYEIPIAIGECFKLTIWEDIIAEDTEDYLLQRTALGCTNCFVKTESNLCFYSRFSYYNNENTHGFIYSKWINNPKPARMITFENFGYLPFHLHSPNFPSEEKSYTKSDGSHVKLFERTDEELTLETDYFDMRIHKCMKVMLSSDNISILNDYFDPRESIMVVCKEAYNIEWEPLGSAVERFAKATTKVVSRQPISLINSNCK